MPIPLTSQVPGTLRAATFRAATFRAATLRAATFRAATPRHLAALTYRVII